MGLFSKVKGFFARIFGGGEVSAMSTPPLISPDFSQEYVPFRAEDGKFVVADTSHDTFSDYPSTGDGKYVMLTYSINDYAMLDFTEPYVPFRAENGKFVKLNVPESLGYPLSGAGKYAVLTYNVNPPGLSGGEVGGDLTIIGGLSTDCGSDDEWCSTFATVCSLSANWDSASMGGIYTVNGETGPGITITEGGIVRVNVTGTNTINVSARQLSASDIINFDEEVCNNPCVSSVYSTVSTNSAFWDSTYTTVSANSAFWNSTYTTVSANSAFWDSTYTTVSANSAFWDSTYTTVSANSGTWENKNIPLYLETYIPQETSPQSPPYYIFGKSTNSHNFRNDVEINELQMSFSVPNNPGTPQGAVAFYIRLFKWDNAASTNVLLASANESNAAPYSLGDMYKIDMPVTTNNLLTANDGLWMVLDGDGTSNSDSTNTIELGNNGANNIDNISFAAGYNTV